MFALFNYWVFSGSLYQGAPKTQGILIDKAKFEGEFIQTITITEDHPPKDPLRLKKKDDTTIGTIPLDVIVLQSNLATKVDAHDTMKDMDAEQVNNNNFANNK